MRKFDFAPCPLASPGEPHRGHHFARQRPIHRDRQPPVAQRLQRLERQIAPKSPDFSASGRRHRRCCRHPPRTVNCPCSMRPPLSSKIMGSTPSNTPVASRFLKSNCWRNWSAAAPSTRKVIRRAAGDEKSSAVGSSVSATARERPAPAVDPHPATGIGPVYDAPVVHRDAGVDRAHGSRPARVRSATTNRSVKRISPASPPSPARTPAARSIAPVRKSPVLDTPVGDQAIWPRPVTVPRASGDDAVGERGQQIGLERVGERKRRHRQVGGPPHPRPGRGGSRHRRPSPHASVRRARRSHRSARPPVSASPRAPRAA